MNDERHVIFGTAGHVDHGKSTLVFALTGSDPDRLAEEKEREMTIDLGFAFLELPGLRAEAAIVDVPGHEMFVRNMVAGATGIDAAIFVVAADEGVMPQTVEHLDILRFLNISAGVIVLTKKDKVAESHLGEVTTSVRELVRGTFLEAATIIAVSSVTKEGIPALKEELARVALAVSARKPEGAFRMPIDRVFTLKGIGTVVTGTVISGTVETGERVDCLPQGLSLRIRTLQVHNSTVTRAAAGQRAAVNLAGTQKEDLSRGDVLATPGAMAATLMFDARVALSARAPRPLEQRTRVRVHHGTREVMARVVLLERDQLAAGESGLTQFRLEAPLVVAAADAFVMRSYSPQLVIGGGSVVDAHPPKRKAGTGAEDVAKKEASPVADLIVEALDGAGAAGMDSARLQVAAGLSESALRDELSALESRAQARAGRRNVWFSAGAIGEMETAIVARLVRLHEEDPIRAFAPLNAVVAEAAKNNEHRECFRLAVEALGESGRVVVSGERVRLATHSPKWSGRLAAARESILGACLRSGLATPATEELALQAGLAGGECERVLSALADAGELRRLAEGIYVHAEAFARSRDAVLDFLLARGKMNIAQARDLLSASRKFLLPFLEELDREGLTAREGDFRSLRRTSAR